MDALTAVLFVLGLVLLVGGAESLVRGASRLAATIGVSPLVIGLTVVAYGTSAPEMAVSVQAGLREQSEIALGNVIGSNTLNILLILGIAATITPLVVARRVIRLDVPLMVGISILVLLLALDRSIGRLEAIVLLAGAFAFTAWSIGASRREPASTDEFAAGLTAARETSRGGAVGDVVLVLAGFGFLVLGAHWLVNGAVELAEALDVSDLVIGLTIVAIGTSLPEIATSVVASLRGERDMAVGNIVGSNIFNLLIVLSLAALVQGEIRVPSSALRFDLPLMVAVAVACLPIFFTGALIARWEGLLFLGYYFAYLAYLLLEAAAPEVLPAYIAVILLFVAPLTALTLLYLAALELRLWLRRGRWRT